MIKFKLVETGAGTQIVEIVSGGGLLIGQIVARLGQIEISSSRFKDAQTNVGPFTNSVTFDAQHPDGDAPSMIVRFQ